MNTLYKTYSSSSYYPFVTGIGKNSYEEVAYVSYTQYQGSDNSYICGKAEFTKQVVPALNTISITDTGEATIQNCYQMFNACVGLTDINLSQMNLENVTDASYMFANCSNLANIGDINLPNCIDAKYIFSKCTNLTNIGTMKFR